MSDPIRPFTDDERSEVVSILGYLDDGCKCYDSSGHRIMFYGLRGDYPFTCLACRARALLKALGIKRPETAADRAKRTPIGPGKPNVRRPRKSLQR